MELHEDLLDRDADGIPAHQIAKPSRFEQPVTWLLGSDLLRQIGWIVLNSFFGRRLGGLDWMHAEIITAEKDHYEQAIAAARAQGTPDPNEEIWFDYIADSGDSQEATYSVATLCLSDFWASELEANAPLAAEKTPQAHVLPRGQFLFVGGDTAYHVSNPRTLLHRFQAPFCWAHKDLTDRKRASASRPGRIYAIPGNHDYYDSLRGFNRQFRRPTKGTGLLSIPCFERKQEASYVALELPWNWWLLGLDTQEGQLDFRQRHFFQQVLARHKPEKLILATPEPATVFDRRSHEHAAIVRSLRQLDSGLETPLLDDTPLPAGHCRLDIAGDVHHYARYGGPPASASYASVVSGLGGAFLHPTHTTLGTVAATARFPSAHESRRMINQRLFKVLPVLKAGNLPLLGFVLAVVLFLAWSADGTGEFLAWLTRTVDRMRHGQPAQDMSLSHMLGAHEHGRPHTSAAFWSIALGVLGMALALASLRKSMQSMHRPLLAYLGFAIIAVAPFAPGWLWPGTQAAGLAQSAIMLMFVILGLFMAGAAIWHRELLNERAMHSTSASVTWLDRWLSLGIGACGFVSIMGGFIRYGDQPTSTVAVHLAFLVLFLMCIIGLPLVAVVVGPYWQRKAAPQRATAPWQRTRLLAGRWLDSGAWLLLGLWHGVLQFFIPLLWLTHGLSWALIPGALLLIMMNYAGYRVALCKHAGVVKLGLVALWLLAGAMSLAIPLLFPGQPWLSTTESSLWQEMAAIAATGVLTALSSGLWFSWYLAVSLAFNRHNNEAGAVSRIASFAELVRIKLTPESLTAYVIGIDRVSTDGTKLEPRLVDVFTLHTSEPER